MKTLLAVSALILSSAFLFTLALPTPAFSQAPPIGCAMACNVGGAGRSCPTQANTPYKYFCTNGAAGTACGGPALQTSGCVQNQNSCGSQMYKDGSGIVEDPNDPGTALPCTQTQQECANAICPQPPG